MAQAPVLPFTVDLYCNHFSGGPIEDETFLNQFSHEELLIGKNKRYYHCDGVHITIERDRIKKTEKRISDKGSFPFSLLIQIMPSRSTSSCKLKFPSLH